MATDTAVEWDQNRNCLRGYIYKKKREKIHHILHFVQSLLSDEPDDQLV